MYLTSKFGDLPPIPDANVHDLYFATAPGASDLPEYDLYVDGRTGDKVTLHQFRQTVQDVATALVAPASDGGLSVTGDARDIVGIFSHNCIDFLTLCHASLMVTTPFALFSAYATPYELAHALRTVKPRYIFVQPSLLPTAISAAKEVGLPAENIFTLNGQIRGFTSLQDIVKRVQARGGRPARVHSATRDTLAYLIFSSGTTGLPKAVAISHGNLWAMCFTGIKLKQIDDEFTGSEPADKPLVALAFLPFYHAYSLHVTALRPFLAPSTTVILDKWDATTVLRLVEKHQINVLSLVPSTIHQLVNHPAWDTTDMSSVMLVGSGASYLPPVLRERLMQRFKGKAVLQEGYGMSEQTLGCVRRPLDGLLGLHQPYGACGLLSPGVEARILREDGSDADIDEPGELWVKGPIVALGYYGNEQATKETFVDGWLRTGDILKVDKDGFFYFVERKKDTLKVGGLQVSPTEIEDVIRTHPAKLVSDTCVGGVPGRRLSDENVPRAWIVLSEEGKRLGVAETVRMIDEWTRKNLSSYKWLRGGIEVVDEIPKTPTGKVMRRVLQDRFTGKAKL